MQYLNEIVLITILFTAVIDSCGNLKLSYIGTYNCFTCTAGICMEMKENQMDKIFKTHLYYKNLSTKIVW